MMILRYLYGCCYQDIMKSYASNHKTLHTISRHSVSLEDHRDFILYNYCTETLNFKSHRKRHRPFETFVRPPIPLRKITTNNTSNAFKQLQKPREYNDTKIFG